MAVLNQPERSVAATTQQAANVACRVIVVNVRGDESVAASRAAAALLSEHGFTVSYCDAIGSLEMVAGAGFGSGAADRLARIIVADALALTTLCIVDTPHSDMPVSAWLPSEILGKPSGASFLA